MLIFDFISILKIEIESIFGEFGKSQQQFDAESRNAFHFHQASERIPIAILILPSTLYAHYLSVSVYILMPSTQGDWRQGGDRRGDPPTLPQRLRHQVQTPRSWGEGEF